MAQSLSVSARMWSLFASSIPKQATFITTLTARSSPKTHNFGSQTRLGHISTTALQTRFTGNCQGVKQLRKSTIGGWVGSSGVAVRRLHHHPTTLGPKFTPHMCTCDKHERRGITALSYPKVAIIGAGVMGEAIVERLVGGGYAGTERCVIYDVSKERAELVASLAPQCSVASTPQEAVIDADLIILSVKPQNIAFLSGELKKKLPKHTTLLSVLAGTTVDDLKKLFAVDKVVRTMPNSPAAIGEGVVVWSASDALDVEAQDNIAVLLSGLGEEVHVKDERFIDMATAISGSGPAYVYLAMESMVDAGVHLGFPREVARKLVSGTFHGSATYAKETKRPLTLLRNDVTSPGGTTAAALYVLEKGGLRTTLCDAVFAAYSKAKSLGGKNNALADGMKSGMEDSSF
eukprot:m.23007 g.23007  ORF g.23007 m.23007 type:complete len:404 (-) comp14032_c0_seq1:79-1290(-)